MARGAGLLAMACGTFALGMAEFSMMAVLTPVARSLGVSIRLKRKHFNAESQLPIR